MPDLEEYTRILQRLAIEQEQDRINELRCNQNPKPEVPEDQQVPRPLTPENEESYWMDDPLTFGDEFDSQQSILETPPVQATCNVIVRDDSSSKASSAEAIYSQTISGNISFGATFSQVTSIEISHSQASSPETVVSRFTPVLTDHREEAPVDDVFFNKNQVNWSQIPNLIGDVWTDKLFNKEEKLLDTVQDLFPENALCNAITEDDNAATDMSSTNERDQPLDLEGDLPNEGPFGEALEVG